MTKKVLSFGELLLRICPDVEGNWLEENSLPFYVGGAEANVATALALWGIPSAYLTVLPDNMMARQLSAYLEERGIDTSRVLYQGERLGLYYLPKGKDLKNAAVIYDRAHSSFSALKPGMIDWGRVLEGVGWLHFSAISPALNPGVAAVCEEAVKAANGKDITVSVDLNYRAKLWQYGVAPTAVMPGLVEHCDLVMGNLWAAERMLGIPVDVELTERGRKEDFLEHARQSSEQIVSRFPRVRHVAKTFRFDRGEKGIHYYTTFYSAGGASRGSAGESSRGSAGGSKGELYCSREYTSDAIVDKVGSGDCYMAGLIRGLYRGEEEDKLKPGRVGEVNLEQVADVVEFATAAAFFKLFIPSDATDQPAEDIEKFMMNHGRE
ncbi:MAG TPA: sugar kinase [Puia sp.]|jgi:2-dehydro-3-deoxygluconokinase|nr:sugar kinase [Puia sp.]